MPLLTRTSLPTFLDRAHAAMNQCSSGAGEGSPRVVRCGVGPPTRIDQGKRPGHRAFREAHRPLTGHLSAICHQSRDARVAPQGLYRTGSSCTPTPKLNGRPSTWLGAAAGRARRVVHARRGHRHLRSPSPSRRSVLDPCAAGPLASRLVCLKEQVDLVDGALLLGHERLQLSNADLWVVGSDR